MQVLIYQYFQKTDLLALQGSNCNPQNSLAATTSITIGMEKSNCNHPLFSDLIFICTQNSSSVLYPRLESVPSDKGKEDRENNHKVHHLVAGPVNKMSNIKTTKSLL